MIDSRMLTIDETQSVIDNDDDHKAAGDRVPPYASSKGSVDCIV